MVVRICQGDALTVLRTLESESVQACISSPPYFQLRNYGVDGQIGLEATPAEFIDALLTVFDEVRRVLRKDGTCWVNLGDSYAGSGKGPTGHNGIGDQEQRQGFTGVSAKSTLKGYTAGSQLKKAILGGGAGVEGLPSKNLLLMPERFAIGMQDHGWWVRSRIAWCKTSAMPESVRDRPSSAWEHIWMFSRSRTYYYDAEAVRTPTAPPTTGRNPHGARGDHYKIANNGLANGSGNHPTGFDGHLGFNPAGANLRNYWLLGPEPSSLEHYAGFPTELPRRCILAGTSEKGACAACGAPRVRVTAKGELVSSGPNGIADKPSTSRHKSELRGAFGKDGWGDLPRRERIETGWRPSCAHEGDPVPQTVLDPFSGSGTTLLVADRLGRSAIGIDLNPDYCELARKRIDSDAPMLSEPVTVESPGEQLSLLEALG